MPELAEVEYYRRKWLPALGQKVYAVYLNAEKRVFRGEDTAKLGDDLVGTELTSSEGHGKQMSFLFDRRATLAGERGSTSA